MIGVLLVIGIGQGLARTAWSATGNQSQCFTLRDWNGTWKTAPDSQAIYIRVRREQIYRLDLEGAHPTLKSPFAVLANRKRSTDVICSPLDFDLLLSDRNGGAAHLIVRKMTLLTSSQVTALPKSLRP
jgi:hypothetical protein